MCHAESYFSSAAGSSVGVNNAFSGIFSAWSDKQDRLKV
jgi:hypothetical protein